MTFIDEAKAEVDRKMGKVKSTSDIEMIDKFIADEDSDVMKYSEAYLAFESEEAKSLAHKIALEEDTHKTDWQALKLDLQRKMREKE